MDNAIELGWSLGTKVVLWGAGIGLALVILGVVLLFTLDFGEVVTAVGGFVLLCFGFIGAIGLFPYKTEYWQLYRVSGEAVSVSNVLAEDGGEITRQPVVTLDTLDRDVVIDDPRAANIEGKQVELTCKKHWRYQAADRVSCDIYSIDR